MVRYRLVQGKWTTGQLLVVGLWGANLLAVLFLWFSTAQGLFGSAYGNLLALGWLAGLVATFCALVQFMLMGRVLWLERQFGLDHITHFHRLNGYAVLTAIFIHPILIISAYSVGTGSNFVAQYLSAITELPYVWMALVSEILFITVAATSVYIVRRHLRFERWYVVHLLVYAAIVFAFFHQFALGGSLNGHPVARAYWYSLYGFVAFCVLYWRFSLPTLRLLKYRFQISRVVPETPTSTSVYIRGNGLAKWHIRPGQFVLVRILDKDFWLQEHPFSVSKLPPAELNDSTKNSGEFRLTIRSVGDYTADIQHKLQPGAYVLVSGPFGRFTAAIAETDKRLFIAGGVGITPILPLAKQAVGAGKDSVLIYGSRSTEDVILKQEVDELAGRGLVVHHIYRKKPKNDPIDGPNIARLVPDFLDRDIYLCGPPPMMELLIADLTKRGVRPERLHYERFSLNN